MTGSERDKRITQRERDYYATHKSARVARWMAIFGLLIAIVGFFVSFSLSRVIADFGNGLMVLGVLVACISVYFFSSITRS